MCKAWLPSSICILKYKMTNTWTLGNVREYKSSQCAKRADHEELYENNSRRERRGREREREREAGCSKHSSELWISLSVIAWESQRLTHSSISEKSNRIREPGLLEDQGPWVFLSSDSRGNSETYTAWNTEWSCMIIIMKYWMKYWMILHDHHHQWSRC